MAGFGLPSVNFSQVMSVLGVGVGIGITILAVVVAAVLMRYFMSFNIAVEMIENTATGNRLLKTKGRMNHKKGVFETLKYKTYSYMYPLSEYFVTAGKGLKLFGYAINRSVVWLTIHPNPGFVPADMNMQTYLAQRLRRNWEATQNKVSFWDKYGHQVLWGFTMVIFLIAIIIIVQMINNIGGAAVAARVQSI